MEHLSLSPSLSLSLILLVISYFSHKVIFQATNLSPITAIQKEILSDI
jgi:hypothetical protein